MNLNSFGQGKALPSLCRTGQEEEEGSIGGQDVKTLGQWRPYLIAREMTNEGDGQDPERVTSLLKFGWMWNSIPRACDL